MLKRRTEIGFILGGAIIMCFVAFINRFPLIYSDTADYLMGAFGHYIPADRPVFYGLFMRFVSLQSTLWLVIFVQGLLLSYLLFETFNMFYEGNKRNFLFIIAIGVLTVSTGLSETVSLLLPDVFSPIAILCLINLLLNNKLGKGRRVFVSIIFLLSMLVHLSNMLVMLPVLILLLIYAIIRKVKKSPLALKRERIILCTVLVISMPLLVPAANYLYGGQFMISEYSHVFIMNHLVETGVLEQYLNDECAHKNYKMCQYKDSITSGFMWNPNGVVAKMGGYNGTRADFNRIIFDIMSTPKYAGMVVGRSMEYSFMEYFSFAIPSDHSWGMPPYINNHYSLYKRDFENSMQYNNKLDFSFTNELQKVLVIISLVFLLYVVLTPSFFHAMGFELKWFTLLFLAYSVFNAIICANFSTINNRFQDRIIWLMPLLAFFILEQWYRSGRKKAISE